MDKAQIGADEWMSKRADLADEHKTPDAREQLKQGFKDWMSSDLFKEQRSTAVLESYTPGQDQVKSYVPVCTCTYKYIPVQTSTGTSDRYVLVRTGTYWKQDMKVSHTSRKLSAS
jgi:hypothetical protein